MKLSELKNGAVVELRNGQRYLKVDNTFLLLEDFGGYMRIDSYAEDLKIKDDDPEWDIVKVNNNVGNVNVDLNLTLYNVFKYNEWTWEEPKQILTDKEKEYLKAVCRPFDVNFIEKLEVMAFDEEFLCICVHGKPMFLPHFNKGTMYKGMEVDIKYTLKELGIEYK